MPIILGFVQYRYILYVNCIMYIEFFVFLLKYINWHTNTFNTRGQEISEKNVWIFVNARCLKFKYASILKFLTNIAKYFPPLFNTIENLIITPVDYKQKYGLSLLSAKCLLYISCVERVCVHLEYISLYWNEQY